MHVPRDPGEWVFMAILMGGFMAVGMIGVHCVRTHLGGTATEAAGHGHGGLMQPGIAMKVATSLVALLLRLGIPIAILGPMMLLTVTGRQTGKPRTLPVDVHDVDGRRYLIASHGIGAWVLNLRAKGEGTLRLGRRRVDFVATELEPAQAGPVIRAAFATLIASDGWRGNGIRNNLGVTKTSSESDYVASAAEHPVFELQPKPRSSRR